MEEQKGKYGEQGFLPVPLFISASCFSSVSLRSTNATNRNSNGRLRITNVLVRPYWFVTVSSLSIYWCSYAFLIMCGLGQCSKTTVTQTEGRNDPTERRHQRANSHFRIIHIRKMSKYLLGTDCSLFEVCLSCCVLSLCRSSEFGL